MSLTYTAETYESGPLSTTTEYKLSDGSRWVRIVEEYIAPDMKSRRRTRVLRSDFPGDKEHRDTLTNLQGAIANADVIMYANPSAAEEPTVGLRRYQPGELVHNGTSPVVYTVVRHRKDGKINLTSPDGRSLTLPDDEISPATPASRDEKRDAAIARAKAEDAARVSNPGPEDAPTNEVLDVTFLGFNADKSLSWCVTFADRVLQTVRGETRDEAIAAAIAGREADGLNEEMLPAFVIEPGYEEQAHPLSHRQEAVLWGISAELEADAPMDVIPPLEKFGNVTASTRGEGGVRVAADVNVEGFLEQVRVRFTLAGTTEWVILNPRESDLAKRLLDAARTARRSVKPEDAGLLGE